ncbi:MAG: DNA polymerase Y family protein [Acidocella sp.]|nr:DNA polymerase Y family protein [Acidocella sp.]
MTMQRRLLSLWWPEPVDVEALALWCQFVSPLTVAQPPDGVLIDITGCAHLFGGEAGLRARLARLLPGVRLAIANTATAAWGLARYGANGDDGDEDISALPLAAIGLEARCIARLSRVGVRRVGQLAALPRAELTAGFGPAPALKCAQALGLAPEVLKFCAEPVAWREDMHLPEPIFAPASLQAALSRLTAKLCARLAKAERGATALKAKFYRIDRAVPEFDLNFASPCRDEAQIIRLAHESLARSIDPGFGVEMIRLSAERTECLAAVQTSITRPAPDYQAPVNLLLNRLAPGTFWRAVPHDSHIPEYAARRTPVCQPPAAWTRPRFPRPLRLLRVPDAITAIAPVPDDPPVFFSWRGQGFRVAHATGPERIARDWWCHKADNTRPEDEKIRDYYAVEDASGAAFWLFRAGRHGGVAPARWYLHGFFK